MNFSTLKHSKKCFPEDSKEENGNYINICVECKVHFIGRKGRIYCKECKKTLDK
jgi:hypothetical protein